MNIEWVIEKQDKPLEVKTKGTVKDLDIRREDVSADQIKRTMERSTNELDESGQLYFEVTSRLSVGCFWLQMLDPEFVQAIKFPSGGLLKEPRKDKVTVFQDAKRIVFDVDGLHYAFLMKCVPDNFAPTVKDPKMLAAELVDAVLDALERSGKDELTSREKEDKAE